MIEAPERIYWQHGMVSFYRPSGDDVVEYVPAERSSIWKKAAKLYRKYYYLRDREVERLNKELSEVNNGT